MILRVVSVYPHGSDHRYELQYYGLAAGLYDLRDYLESAVPDEGSQLPQIPVEVRSILPAGHVPPNPLRDDRSLRLGGYRFLAVGAVLLWLLGLTAILLVRRTGPEHARADARPPTLSELLRPRLEAARQASLTAKEYAELERMVIEFWRRRLNLSHLTYFQALSAVREHPSAGPLLKQLERWMHRPGSAMDGTLAELLRPYEDDLDGSTAHATELPALVDPQETSA